MEESQDIFTTIKTFLENTNPIYLGIVAFLLLFLFLIPIILRSRKRSKARKVAPNVVLQSFQISPLGRDAWLRLRNEGHSAELKDFQIKGRKDIGIKTNFRNVKIEHGNTYSLFLQATGKQRIKEDFEITILYEDSIGNRYKQILRLQEKLMLKAKLL